MFLNEHSLRKKQLTPKISGRNGIEELRLVRIEHSAKRDTKKRHKEKEGEVIVTIDKTAPVV